MPAAIDERKNESGMIGDHHGITHNGQYGPMAPTIEMKFVTYFMSTLAYLLNELKSTPEGAGTLLDNCLIYYGSEMAEGYHTTKKMPVVLAGKAGGLVETGRHLQFRLRLTAIHVFRGIKHREVAPNDLLGAVTLDALCARVPAGYVPLRVEQENRVVLDVFNKQPELPANITGWLLFCFHEINGAFRSTIMPQGTEMQKACQPDSDRIK